MKSEREIENYYNNKKNAFDVIYEKDLDLSSVMLAPSIKIILQKNRGEDHEKQE